LNSKLHVVFDLLGRPLILPLTEGQVSDFKGAAIIAPHLPNAKILIADKGYDAYWFRELLAMRDIAACIPARSCHKKDITFDQATYKPQRPMRTRLPFHHRRHRQLLALTNISPEPA
jgi:transposase